MQNVQKNKSISCKYCIVTVGTVSVFDTLIVAAVLLFVP